MTLADNCHVGIGDEMFPAHDSGKRWNGWVCPTFQYAIARRVTLHFNRLHATGPWPDDQDYFVWIGRRIIHLHGAYLGDPDYKPITVEPDAHGRYAIGAMAWTWRCTQQT
jgi:hypothetical protein